MTERGAGRARRRGEVPSALLMRSPPPILSVPLPAGASLRRSPAPGVIRARHLKSPGSQTRWSHGRHAVPRLRRRLRESRPRATAVTVPAASDRRATPSAPGWSRQCASARCRRRCRARRDSTSARNSASENSPQASTRARAPRLSACPLAAAITRVGGVGFRRSRRDDHADRRLACAQARLRPPRTTRSASAETDCRR